MNNLSELLCEFRALPYIQKRIKLDDFAERIDPTFFRTYGGKPVDEANIYPDKGVNFVAAGALTDGTPIRILLALLGERSDDDPDRKVNFFSVGTLIDLVRSQRLPVSVLFDALQPDPNHLEDDWRRYWVTMTLVKIKTDEVANLLMDLIENDSSRSVAAVAVEAFDGDSKSIAVVGKDKILKAVRKRIELEPDNCKDYCSWICREVLKKLEENPGQ